MQKMVNRRSFDSSLSSKLSAPSELQILVCDEPFTSSKELLAAKSAKLAALFEEKDSYEKISYFLRDISADPNTFELVARFCHGFEVQLSTENAVPLICLASDLEMTETHCPNNLLKKAIDFLKERVLPSWNETIRALRLSEKLLQQAVDLGIIEACFSSIVAKAQVDPRLLGKPIKAPKLDESSEGEEDGECRPNARRKLFVLDWQSEDLTTLPLQFYEPVIKAMNLQGIPPGYVAASLCQYVKRWICSSPTGDETMSIYNRNSQREVIEAVERLLPREPRLLPCTLLFQMLDSALTLEASADCRNGFEIRIGRQLDQAMVNDLLIPFRGYAGETQYDIGCVKRILKSFYMNFTCPDESGFIKVADLIEELLAELASDVDLQVNSFLALAEMSLAASIHTNSDGIYRAIDIYLDKHRFLTELEKEEVCRVLDFQKMSPEACEHAVRNERLPLRVVVQVLFTEQLKLRETVVQEVVVHSTQERFGKDGEEEVEENQRKLSRTEEELRIEMERMNSKVRELERECSMMRKEMANGNGGSHKLEKRGKISMWGEIKRKFGCMSNMHDYSSHVKKKKKVHPRHG
ncbi:BTB/POZ domain-containing protein At5g17580 [Rhodamnia argentea]|uniref:BTB/POZ domain-containing protein At5g17580 n=1 Tax=Rhodamnia argentea TaxID=178133 RepID=A0A8B8QWK3_9MYRT|nr:BTB/POZ domain-containing protein At5g17580 [Rhodamnia argentea]